MNQSFEVSALAERARAFRHVLEQAKQRAPGDVAWYPYGSLDNFHLLDLLLEGEDRRIFDRARPEPVADIGAADGETSLMLDSLGFDVDVVDYGPTNYNGMQGVRVLREILGARMGVHEVDLDSQFALPRERYGLAVFLGILYHLKNPYYVLERLARQCRWMLLSTRVTRFSSSAESRVDLQQVPGAYLLAPGECNGDATNYWIFTEPGLRRLIERTGWQLRSFRTFGAVGASDPATAEGDERAFCLAHSLHCP